MRCLHNNVVAIISTPKVEVISPKIGNYVQSKRKIKYVCSACGKISTEKFGSQSDDHYTKIPKSQRYIGKTITIDNEEYWFLNGIEDNNLVFKELHNPTATTYTNSLVNKFASFNDGFASGQTSIAIGYGYSTGHTYSTRSLIDVSNININKMTNEQLTAHLKTVKNEVEKRQSDAKKLLESLREKKGYNQKQREEVVQKIVERGNDLMNKKYGNINNAIEALGKTQANIASGLGSIGSLFEQTIKRGYDQYTTTAPPKENVAKVPTIKDAINYVTYIFLKCRHEYYENDGIMYVDFIFDKPLDQDSEKRVVLELGNVVEWVNVPNTRMGVSSVLFGTTRMIKTIRIKQEDLLATYEKRMGYKVS